jgi:hypothetical protein
MAVPQLKLRMKRSDVLQLYHVLSKLAGSQGLPPGVCYAMARSRRFLRDEAESIESAINESMQVATKAEQKLHRDYAEKDANGAPVVKNGKYVCGDETGFTAAMVRLRTDLDSEGLQRKNMEFLATVIDVTVCPIPIAADQTIWEPGIVEVLLELLEEPTGQPPDVAANAPAPEPIPFPPAAAPSTPTQG